MRERGNRFLRNLDFLAGTPAVSLAAAWRKLVVKAKPVVNPREIGLICLGAIGDLALASSLPSGFKRLWPDSRVTLVVSRANAAAAPLLPDVAKILAHPVTRPDLILRGLRSGKFDLLVDTSQWSRLGAILAALSGAKFTVGFKTPGQFRGAAYDRAVFHRRGAHESENFKNLGLAISPEFAAEPRLRFQYDPERREKIIYCHFFAAPGRGRELKEWPDEYWARLVGEILNRGFNVNLTGSAGDKPRAEIFIKKYFSGERRVQSVAGIFLGKLAALFARAAAVISVNTGIMHVAAIMGVPTVGLHGATNPLRWGPVGPRVEALSPRNGQFAYLNLGYEFPRRVVSAMNYITVGDAIDALNRLEVFGK